MSTDVTRPSWAPDPSNRAPWRIATRRSTLATTQAGQTGAALSEKSGRPYVLVPMTTTGDDHPDRAIEAFDVKGLFVDSVRQAVLNGDCDFVVHSYKDLPTEPVDGLTIAAVPARVDPRDVLVSRDGWFLRTIPRGGAGKMIGTSSARRRAQLLKWRRDLQVVPLRGNLDTRLRKVAEGQYDAIVVALAGLKRLGNVEYDLTAAPIEHGEMLHAPAQGALAIECRSDDLSTLAALQLIHDKDTAICVAAERSLLRELQGGCTAPIGAHATLLIGEEGRPRPLELLGMVSDMNGTDLLRASHHATEKQAELLGQTLAASLLQSGGDQILERIRAKQS